MIYIDNRLKNYTTMKYPLVIIFQLLPFLLMGQSYKLEKVEINVTASFRGLSIADNKIAWLSGSQGWVGRSSDGGNSWQFNQVKGFENSDFRALYAFDDQHAIIANAGTPAHILITSDGGANWKSVYNNPHPDAFFDGIDFWDSKNGIIYGDPIDGKMLMLRTADGGLSWTEISGAPSLEKGEASFAASGTGIRCTNKSQVMIATGGKVSRLWTSNDKGTTWSAITTPMIQGETTTGIFSLLQNKKALIIVGGDYQKENLTLNHNFYSLDGGKNWLAPATPTRGYRECVEPATDKIVLATGPSGTDISYDRGINWQAFSDEKGLHVIRKARKGSLVMLAGGKGQVYRLK
jgi:photosystem II stability/assembly factor-like uncharacterized protein